MAIPYERAVAEDLNLGHGTVSVTMPGGGSATGHKISIHTFIPRAYSILDFGAVGDGVAEDHVAIQAAIDEAYGDGGGYVVIPPGTYLLGAAIALQPLVVVGGYGFSSILKRKANATWTADLDSGISAASYVGVERIAFDGNKANQSDLGNGVGIWLGRTRGFVRHCFIYNTVRSGVVLGNSNAASDGNDFDVSGNVFDACGHASGTMDVSAISVVNAKRVAIRGNHITSTAGAGIDLEKNTSADSLDKITVIGNAIESTSGKQSCFGIAALGVSGGSALFLTIQGNTVVGDSINTKIGINCEYTDRCAVVGNVVTRAIHHGIRGLAFANGIISGNAIATVGQATTNTYDGINCDSASDKNAIVGNTISAGGSATVHRYGVKYDGTNATVVGNHVDDYGTGSVVGAGAGVVLSGNST